MKDHLEIVADGEGLSVIGDRTTVARFLGSRGLLATSTDFRLDKLHGLLQASDAVLDGASDIMAGSGRWLKLTDESADMVREFGLMESGSAGVSYAMIGDPGVINKWIRVDTGLGAMLTNPALLTGVVGVMAQVARQGEMREIKAYLAAIDTRLTEVARAQKDAELAKVVGARSSIERALSLRDAQGGRTDATTWSTVQDRVGAVDDALSWAIIRLSRVAERIEAVDRGRQRVELVQRAPGEVCELLAVIAHCFELQDALDVMQLDRVFEESPNDLEAQRSALDSHRETRRALVRDAVEGVASRIDSAARTANSNTLLHMRAARAMTDSANNVGQAVARLELPLGIESERQALRAPGWWEAARDSGQLANAGAELAPKLVLPAAGVGVGLLYKLPGTRPLAQKAIAAARRIVR
ncbi:hypothetical protein [Agrococcus citreus]|uniref:Uncharacterized protein n=1 Tax=Agrococcus citreus TaxID=84643 RepID=A0ABN1YPI2_9MICO